MLETIKVFVEEKKIKLDCIIRRFYKLPTIEFVKDISIMTSLFVEARNNLNQAVEVLRDVEMLHGLVKKTQTDLNYLVDEDKIEKLSDPQWLEDNATKKMSKEERDLLARIRNKDLYDSAKLLDKFMNEVTALKRTANHKKEDYDRVRKDIAALVWSIRTEKFFNGGVVEPNVQKYLSTESADMDTYLDPTKRS